MSKRDNDEIIINTRNLNNEKNSILLVNNKIKVDADQERFELLKSKLKDNIKDDIYNKIEAMHILKEIKEKEYYKLDGYKSFSQFIKNYKLAKSQAYSYLRIANAIQDGILKEEYLIENGFRQSLSFLMEKESRNLKKSKVNPIKPLRFQLKSQESYDYYKKNAKFTSFLMDELFKDKKDLLEEFMKRFKNLKGEV
ncbi:chromosome replication/partitioning protein (plasmid) [Borrelia miyamotoi]|uniref:Chromosome replication/partitioning protein n=1 Tax=Borrelia miyamotoi TaxID=47466 RepID=A0A5P8AUW5_9SPIR|nr:chromosome replication/partitioning protein [Borrelia miyamotoi]QFP42593.1 chromosome replication/partitioning protein [Borrelia miyamotoi]WAZ72518.1 chromosome replication/partitioning protein [Borrelia miyamotoi]WVI05685.1 chromosome replication/partitioning protein [Borrelia miyamotoi]